MKNQAADDLIAEWLAGTLPPERVAELERRLRDDPELRRTLLHQANLDAGLREWATDVGPASAWTASTGQRPASTHRWSWAAMTSLGLAAALAMAAVWWIKPASSISPRSEQTALGCAILTEAVGADWNSIKNGMRLGDTINTGTLELTHGIVQIEFFSGATLVLEGPAELEIVSPWEVVCLHGKARVRVPPAAIGFRMKTPGMTLVDFGTEFAAEVNRSTQGASVQVFDGEIEARPEHPAAPITLKRGQGIKTQGTTIERFDAVEGDTFINTARLGHLSREQGQANFTAWELFSEQQRHDPRLLAYYPMSKPEGGLRLLKNAALPANNAHDGGAVGAVWSEGRWPQKSALEFKRPGDRVRLQIDGTYEAVTIACWARVDGLDRHYNALFLTDGYGIGEPHWQIYEDGRLMFSLMAPPDPAHPPSQHNQIYFSPVLFNRANTGRWHHLAVTYDNQSGAAVQYFDGAEVSREVHRFHQPGRPISFGGCEIGNWGIPVPNHAFPIRNLNGRIDEFALYAAALDAGEIRAMFEAGRPE